MTVNASNSVGNGRAEEQVVFTAEGSKNNFLVVLKGKKGI